MDIFRVAGDFITAVLMIFTSTGWPPAASGAFWMMVGLWGIVSILFEDETPRGIPGLDVIVDYQREIAAKKQVQGKD